MKKIILVGIIVAVIIALFIFSGEKTEPPFNCQLTDFTVEVEFERIVNEEYPVNEKALKAGLGGKDGGYIIYNIEGKTYVSERKSKEKGKSIYDTGEKKELTLCRDKACNSLRELEKYTMLTQMERFTKSEKIVSDYKDECMEIIRKYSEPLEDIIVEPEPGVSIEEDNTTCSSSIDRMVHSENVKLTIKENMEEGTRIKLQFEPLDKDEMMAKQINYSTNKLYINTRKDDEISVSRSELGREFQKIDLIVSVLHSESNQPESQICQFDWNYIED